MVAYWVDVVKAVRAKVVEVMEWAVEMTGWEERATVRVGAATEVKQEEKRAAAVREEVAMVTEMTMVMMAVMVAMITAPTAMKTLTVTMIA